MSIPTEASQQSLLPAVQQEQRQLPPVVHTQEERIAKVLAVLARETDVNYTQLPLDGDYPKKFSDTPLFQEETVTSAVKKADQITPEERGALQRLYGPALDALNLPETDSQGESNIYAALFARLFDPGTLKHRKCLIPFEGKDEDFEEPGVPVLTRASFITRVLEEHAKREKGAEHKHVSIGMIDLSNLRGADFELGGQEDKSADVLVNKAARAIRAAFEELKLTDKAKLTSEDKSWEIGRYGGDEFVIGLFGNFTLEERKAIYAEIQNQISAENNQSYYQHTTAEGTKVIRKEPIGLKDVNKGAQIIPEFPYDKVSVIEFPDDTEPHLSERRLMFQEYLERGLLLTPDEFAKIVTKYSPNGTYDSTLYRKDYPQNATYYPKGVETPAQRIEYIQKQHPELAFYFDLANHLDKADHPDTPKGILLRTIENSLFDRLIGEVIYSRDQFQEFLNNEEFSSVRTIDHKFIKEMNDNMTYADADMAVKSMWGKIRESFGPQDREKVMIARLGGTFVIGVRKGMTLSLQTEEALDKINKATLILDEPNYSIPVCSTKKDILPQKTRNPGEKEERILLKDILQENEDEFYRRLALDILLEDLHDSSFIDYIHNTDVKTLSDKPLNKRNLYTLFLKGKRMVERLPKLLSSYNSPTNGQFDIGKTLQDLSKDSETSGESYNIDTIMMSIINLLSLQSITASKHITVVN